MRSEQLSLPGSSGDKVLFLWKSVFQDPTGHIPGRGTGGLSLNGVVRMEISSPGLITHEAAAWEGWGSSGTLI